jgi:hypothetical protein
MLPVDSSTKPTKSGTVPYIGVPEKSAVGAAHAFELIAIKRSPNSTNFFIIISFSEPLKAGYKL